MAQYARPDSDITVGSWTSSTGATLYGVVDESSASDSDYFYRSGGDDTCEVGLSNVTDPVSSSGHVLRVRSNKSGVGTITSLTASLMQGASTIASTTCYVTDATWTTTTLNLSAAEADSITDYSDLRVRLVQDWASGVATRSQVSWIEFEVPDAPVVGGQPMMTRATSVPYMRQWQPGRR